MTIIELEEKVARLEKIVKILVDKHPTVLCSLDEDDREFIRAK